MNEKTDTRAAEGFAGRYVILTHDHPVLHWDLMLEANGVLKTWRLLAEPGSTPIIAAEPLADHRLFYLDYEGPVSGDRGTVTRWDQGQHQSTPAGRGLTITLQSERFGEIDVSLTEDAEAGWTLRRTD